MDNNISTTIGINSRKATMDKTTRINPVVLDRAKVINIEATNIKAMAIKDAHILSILLIVMFSPPGFIQPSLYHIPLSQKNKALFGASFFT